VNWLLVAALAAAGLVIGWCLRPLVFRLTAAAAEPPGAAESPPGAAVSSPGVAGSPRGMAGSPPGAAECPPGAAGSSPGVAGSPPSAAGSPPSAAECPPSRGPSSRARTGPPPLALELCTAILLGGLAARIHPGLVLAAACWLAVCTVALAWIDVAAQRLPDVLTVPAYAGTVVLLVAAAAAGGHWSMLLRALLGGLALAAAYLALAVISRGAVGLGDAKLAASLGTLTAWYGWPRLVAGVFAGFLLGAIYGVGLLAWRRATSKQRIAFGPFMVAGAFLAVLAAAAAAGS
jgi:leader peptidase (prepilin peptidase) / N-methyltransferase